MFCSNCNSHFVQPIGYESTDYCEGCTRINGAKLQAENAKLVQRCDKIGKERDVAYGFNHELEEENAKLNAKLEAHRWIPVEERLPKETEDDLRPKHLIYNADGIAAQEWRHYDFGWSFDDYTGPPTHWMEQITLPE